MSVRFSGRRHHLSPFFFFNDTATTEIYTLSLHDALPIYPVALRRSVGRLRRLRLRILKPVSGRRARGRRRGAVPNHRGFRSEEHTSELQSQSNLVCRLLLEKKKKMTTSIWVIGTATSPPA